MSIEYTRRASDHRVLNIEDMIAAEDDAKSRAMLIVLNSINLSLVANTNTVRDISLKLEAHLLNFDEHTQQEQEMLNKGKGMWKVIAWVLATAQVAGLALAIEVRSELLKSNEVDTAIALRMDRVEQVIKRIAP